jgi:hypothetical protein
MRGGQALDPIETTSVVVVPKSWHSIEHRVLSYPISKRAEYPPCRP